MRHFIHHFSTNSNQNKKTTNGMLINSTMRQSVLLLVYWVQSEASDDAIGYVDKGVSIRMSSISMSPYGLGKLY